MIFAGRISAQNFVEVKGGFFKPGNPEGDSDERPAKTVRIKSFLISATETTNEQYCKFLNQAQPRQDTLAKWINLEGHWENEKCRISKTQNQYTVEQGYENHPVVFVSWYGAKAFCTFNGGRLPMEIEWEYSARGGKLYKLSENKPKIYAGSTNADETAVYQGNSNNHISAVASKAPNQIGIYDMSGNVAEWCEDWYHPQAYAKNKLLKIKLPSKANFKVHRGGSWYNSLEMIRVGNRRASKPKNQSVLRGFRMVKKLKKS